MLSREESGGTEAAGSPALADEGPERDPVDVDVPGAWLEERAPEFASVLVELTRQSGDRECVHLLVRHQLRRWGLTDEAPGLAQASAA
ncbi:hypothetical protein [Streptomyces sp. OE57]|uniref:hypothetical protein n=1 Tax=Streptomyces lacaronensis TaxID=3379885 RepID=UPI0039B75D2F